MLLAQLQEVGIQLSKDQLAVLADTRERIDFGPGAFTVTTNALFQADGVEVYDSDCDDVPNAQPSFMANISSYGSDALAEVHNPDNMANSMINQDVQYVKETQQAVVRNSNSSTQQDALILSMIEQLKTQDLMVLEKKVNTTPVDYAALNQLSRNFEKRFVPLTELSAVQAFWSQNSLNSSNPSSSFVDHKEKDLVITALKNELRKLKGKDLADNAITKCPIAPEMFKINVEPIAPRLLNNMTAHSDYLRHSVTSYDVRELVRTGKLLIL
ncbi:hypothetical protein Tco_0387433 [Tanacetum coccineum]